MIHSVLAKELLNLLHQLGKTAPSSDVLALKCGVLRALVIKAPVSHDKLRVGRHVLSLLYLFALLLVFLVLLAFFVLLERLHRLGVDVISLFQWHEGILVNVRLLRPGLLRFLAVIRGCTVRALNTFGCKGRVDL